MAAAPNSSSTSQGNAAQLGPTGVGSDYNALASVVMQHLARLNTIKIVQIKKFTAGQNGMAGTVDVQALNKQQDSEGNTRSYGTTHNLIYVRAFGGGSSVIHDPAQNDIGIALISDRDNTNVIANRAEASPGSSRRFDLADGIYLGGVLNNAPTQALQFLASGLTLFDSNGNKVMLTSTANAIKIVPKDTGHLVYLGGDPDQGGTYDFVALAGGGASINVKARKT